MQIVSLTTTFRSGGKTDRGHDGAQVATSEPAKILALVPLAGIGLAAVRSRAAALVATARSRRPPDGPRQPPSLPPGYAPACTRPLDPSPTLPPSVIHAMDTLNASN